MAKVTNSLSLEKLEKLIEDRTADVEALLRKRDELADEIEKLDDEIQNFLTAADQVEGPESA